MKRLICLLLVLGLVLCGCGADKTPAEDTATTTTTTVATVATDDVTSATEETLTSPTAESTQVSDVTTTTGDTLPSASQGTTASTATNTAGATQTTGASTGGTTVTTNGTYTTTAGTTHGTTEAVRTTKPSRNTTYTTQTTTTVVTTTVAANGVTLLGPDNGTVLESQTPIIDQYLAITDEKKAAEFWKGTYTSAARGPHFLAEWKSSGNLWKVYFSEDPNFTGVRPTLTTDQFMLFSGLMPGRTYYWKVVNTYGVASETRCVTVKDTQVRWVYMDGGDNIRDLGGWKTESGKTVKYGMLFRGAGIDGYKGAPTLTQYGRETFKFLGVKTEIDLRGNSDLQTTSSPFGAKYYRTPMTQFDYIYNNDQTKKSLKEIFNILSFKGSYPIYYHCNAGGDRAGTLSFIISGMLGVSREDLTRDFELTCFSGRGKRLRSKLDETTGLFDPSGVMQRNGGNYIAWGPLYDTMMRDYGTASGKLSDAIANFLITECGVTQQEIDAVRSIMLE